MGEGVRGLGLGVSLALVPDGGRTPPCAGPSATTAGLGSSNAPAAGEGELPVRGVSWRLWVDDADGVVLGFAGGGGVPGGEGVAAGGGVTGKQTSSIGSRSSMEDGRQNDNASKRNGPGCNQMLTGACMASRLSPLKYSNDL